MAYSYCLVSNIPSSFHSSDLRNFFAVFREDGKFDLFHFRHRPQNITPSTPVEGALPLKKFCALVRFKDNRTVAEFMRKYHHKVWIDKAGNELHSKVIISRVTLSQEDLDKFRTKELQPPAIMPKGNVGTPNKHFLNLIKQCKLPPSLITKLGLEFPRGRVFKRYSKVPFDYGTNLKMSVKEEDEDDFEEITDGKGRVLSSSSKKEEDKTEEGDDNDEDGNESHSDDDGCEEWERHEALNDHRTSHGTMFDEDKERLYEEKIELKWEKGGSGLVFYTDAQVWEAQEEDTDDWDVDMEGYYVPGGGDKDARDYMEMRRSERFQSGLEDISVFSKSSTKRRRTPSPELQGPSSSTSKKIGSFEKHTKGIGRKVMEQRGWTDGQGLGIPSNSGIPDALGNEGQGPADRRGLGYYGPKIEFTTKAERRQRKEFKEYFLNSDSALDQEKIIIGTVYDKPSDLDIHEPLKRRNATTFIKRYDKKGDDAS